MDIAKTWTTIIIYVQDQIFVCNERIPTIGKQKR